jgi:predicted lipid-binding transport protein (Tim44 family)
LGTDMAQSAPGFNQRVNRLTVSSLLKCSITSKQINYVSDKEQKIIEGKKDEISEINDIWTFKKDIKSPNPNWLVSATSS